VLIAILTDMSDLYFASYLQEEEVFKALCDSKSSQLTISPEIIESLLGGSYLSLLDCRFAFTDVVIDRYTSQMKHLSLQVSSRMAKVLLKLLTSNYLSRKGRDSELLLIKNIYRDIVSVCALCAAGEGLPTDSAGRLYEILEALYKLDLGLANASL
jgi:hypothetical protein